MNKLTQNQMLDPTIRSIGCGTDINHCHGHHFVRAVFNILMKIPIN